MEVKFYPKLCFASGFTLTKSTGTITLQEVQLNNITSGCLYRTAEATVWKYLDWNIGGILHNFQRHFIKNG